MAGYAPLNGNKSSTPKTTDCNLQNLKHQLVVLLKNEVFHPYLSSFTDIG